MAAAEVVSSDIRVPWGVWVIYSSSCCMYVLIFHPCWYNNCSYGSMLCFYSCSDSACFALRVCLVIFVFGDVVDVIVAVATFAAIAVVVVFRLIECCIICK